MCKANLGHYLAGKKSMNYKVWLIFLLVSQSAVSQHTDVIPFQWTENYSAMLVEVKLKDRPGKYYMQLDLGSPHTVLYKNALPGSKDTLRDYAFKVHDMQFAPKKIPVLDMRASDNIVGTLGADLITNRVAIFDYPGKQLILADSLPDRYSAKLHPFYFMAGRVLLPAQVMGKSTILFFDTGSSAYALMTDSATAVAMSFKGSTATSAPVNSWGRTLTAHTFPSGDSIVIAGRALPLGQVTWVSGTSAAQEKQMRQLGIGGLMGNRIFLHHILILDTRKKLFGIAER